MHLDMNSYFASVEQQANPDLRGKPVGIIKAIGRGCVIAASVEAKKFGVKTGSTVWEARQLCPQITFVPSDMDKYFSVTEGFIRILNDYSPTLEVFSIDECFLDISDTQKLFAGGSVEMALQIKVRVRAELGEWIKCSVGIGWNRVVAKLASELNKPDGLTILTPQNYVEMTEKVAVAEVCGIGRSRAKYLAVRGALTLGQARSLSDLPKELWQLVWLKGGDNLTTNEDLQAAKSVSRTYTTFKVPSTKCEVLRLVRNLCEEVAAKLREMGMAGRTLALFTQGNEGNFWARKTLKIPVDDGKLIFDQLWGEYQKAETKPVRQAGVWVSNLVLSAQCSLFNRRQEFLGATDKVNQKFGLFTLYPASLLGGELIRPEVTGFLGDKWYRFGHAYRQTSGLERT